MTARAPWDLAATLRDLLHLARLDGELRDRERTEPPAEPGDLADQRRALLAQLPEEIAAMCQALARARRHPIVATIASGYCTACHLRVPAQLANAVAHALEIYRCPHCQRLFYRPDGADSPDA